MISAVAATFLVVLSLLIQVENPSEDELVFQDAFQALAAVSWCGLSAQQVQLDRALRAYVESANSPESDAFQQQVDGLRDIVEQMRDATISDGMMDAFCREVADNYRERSE